LTTSITLKSQISAAARREELVGKHRGIFVDCTALLSDLDPGKMSPELLDKIANRMIEQALDGDPRAIAEAQRLIEAGETPTIEDCMRVVEQKPGK
jgi:hypothetical protein